MDDSYHHANISTWNIQSNNCEDMSHDLPQNTNYLSDKDVNDSRNRKEETNQNNT